MAMSVTKRIAGLGLVGLLWCNPGARAADVSAEALVEGFLFAHAGAEVHIESAALFSIRIEREIHGFRRAGDACTCEQLVIRRDLPLRGFDADIR